MTILTAKDGVIADMMAVSFKKSHCQFKAVSCLGPTYIALRHQGKRQLSYWSYSPDLAATLRDIAAQCSLTEASPPDTVELCFTHSYRRISTQQFERVFANVHVGIRGIELHYKDQIARYSPTDMLARNLTFCKILDRFLQTTTLSKKEFFQHGTVQTFEARQVLLTIEPTVTAVSIYRGTPVVALDRLSTTTLHEMTATMGQWLMRQVTANGRLLYKYFPSRGQEATSNNLIRQFMATLCLIRYARMTGRDDHQLLATHNLTYNLSQFYRSEDELGFVEYRGKVKLGAVALTALAILEYADLLSVSVDKLPQTEHFTKLCRTVETLWQPDGAFRTFLKPCDRNDNQNFYPGEALLFWASLYQRTRAPELLERCKKSFGYYQNWHQQNRNPAFVPWHTQAYTLLYRETKDPTFLDAIFEMNDWLMMMQQWETAKYPDLLGRFYNPEFSDYGPPHASSTGVYLEGLADAYDLAIETGDSKRAARYQTAIWRGLRSIRQLQFKNKSDLFYISQPSPVYGAVRTTVYNNVIRIDNVQHCLMALIKLVQLPYFLATKPDSDLEKVTESTPKTFSIPATVSNADGAASLKHFRLIAPSINIQPFLKEITDNASLWQKDTSRQERIKVQRETNSIYLRSAVKPFPVGVTNGNDVHGSRQTSIAKKFPVIMQWLESFTQESEGELGRATIVRLAPKGQVYRHIDKGDYYRIRDRYHLVLQSAAGSLLGAGDEWIRMQPGEFWWFDNKAPHEAYNEADTWRIHLIFDVLPSRTS
ncbi:MAG: aspartyl/asparaginyl beta-hydroxylase domain-containing protein [Cyanobacteria bacterium P01_H01_bin.21]